jgi:hypothetical protein
MEVIFQRDNTRFPDKICAFCGDEESFRKIQGYKMLKLIDSIFNLKT